MLEKKLVPNFVKLGIFGTFFEKNSKKTEKILFLALKAKVIKNKFTKGEIHII